MLARRGADCEDEEEASLFIEAEGVEGGSRWASLPRMKRLPGICQRVAKQCLALRSWLADKQSRCMFVITSILV